MKISKEEFLIKRGSFAASPEARQLHDEILAAIQTIRWPVGSDKFTLYPEKKANGVKPIKLSFQTHLKSLGWELEKRVALASRLRPGPVDAVKKLRNGTSFAVEWETGNISSTHRAINKMAIGMLEGKLSGGVLILPMRDMYKFLTDRTGNFEEIAPYFPVWQNWPAIDGVLGIIGIEQDATSLDVPKIPKGTDGRALV